MDDVVILEDYLSFELIPEGLIIWIMVSEALY